MNVPSVIKRRLRASRYIDVHKIARDALGWRYQCNPHNVSDVPSIIHRGYFPQVHGTIAFFWARNFCLSKNRLRMCFDSSRKRDTRENFASLFLYSFYRRCIDDRSIRAVRFHDCNFAQFRTKLSSARRRKNESTVDFYWSFNSASMPASRPR